MVELGIADRPLGISLPTRLPRRIRRRSGTVLAGGATPSTWVLFTGYAVDLRLATDYYYSLGSAEIGALDRTRCYARLDCCYSSQ